MAAFAAEKAFVPATNPRFNPDTGQINPGAGQPVPTSSHLQIDIPTTAQVRAALIKIKGPMLSNPATNGYKPLARTSPDHPCIVV